MERGKERAMPEVAARIKHLREKLGASILEVATYTKLSRHTINRIENGLSINIENIVRLAKFFGVSVEYLILGKQIDQIVTPLTRRYLRLKVSDRDFIDLIAGGLEIRRDKKQIFKKA